MRNGNYEFFEKYESNIKLSSYPTYEEWKQFFIKKFTIK